MRKIKIILILTFFLNNLVLAQFDNPFHKGFKTGFREGYCYNNNAVDCLPPLVPLTPLPTLNERNDSYTDGYNRGFQTGVDLKRLHSGSKTANGTPYENIPNYKFNDYIPQIPINAYSSALAYREALFAKSVQWIQQRIDGIYNLASTLLSKEGYTKIQASFANWHTYIKSRRDLDDFSDNRVITELVKSLRLIESEVYEIYKTEAVVIAENERINQFNKLLTAATNNLYLEPKTSLKLVEEAEKMNIEYPYIYQIKSIAYENLEMLELALENKNKYISSANLENIEKQTIIFEKSILLIKLSKYVDALIQLNSYVFNDVSDSLGQSILFLKMNIYYGQNDFKNSLHYGDKYLSGKVVNDMSKEDIIRVKQIKAASLRELGRYKEALDVINLVIKENNSTANPSLYATKGKIYFLIKDYKNAVNEFLKTTMLDDSDAESFYYLGLCYKKLNLKAKACENFQKAIKLGSTDALEEFPKTCK